MRNVVALLAAIVLLAPPSVLAADLDQFWNKVKKSAPSQFDTTPPVICVCKDGGVNQNRAGQLFSFLLGDGSVLVRCEVLFFDPASELLAGAGCNSWELLPK
jgi:hypothetical protein